MISKLCRIIIAYNYVGLQYIVFLKSLSIIKIKMILQSSDITMSKSISSNPASIKYACLDTNIASLNIRFLIFFDIFISRPNIALNYVKGNSTKQLSTGRVHKMCAFICS